MHIILVIKRNRCVITYVVPQTKYAVAKKYTYDFLDLFLRQTLGKTNKQKTFYIENSTASLLQSILLCSFFLC